MLRTRMDLVSHTEKKWVNWRIIIIIISSVVGCLPYATWSVFLLQQAISWDEEKGNIDVEPSSCCENRCLQT